MKRRLTINKEVLTELAADELADVFGGTRPATFTTCTACTFIPTRRCN